MKTGDESLIGVFAGLGFLSILGIKVYRKKQS
ncbi:LPXTG cell wall anchor domain-containing protein [Thomasclavelia cocleata]